MDPAMKDCFGFTEPEVEAMADYYGHGDKMDGIREWYNGYIFGGDTVIYNPWSIINYLSAPEAGLRPYWVHTSANRMVKETLQLNKRDSRETMERLLKGEEVRREVAVNIVYPQIRTRPDVAWSFLLHGGYLKASERQQHEISQDYRLEIPNREVRYSYMTTIKDWLEEDVEAGESFHSFIRGIREGDATLIAEGLGEILLGLASFHDTASQGEKEEKKRAEGFYHGLVLGMLAYLSGEVHSGEQPGMRHGPPRYRIDSTRPWAALSCSAVRVQTGACYRNHTAKAVGAGGLYPGGAKIPGGGAGEVEPGKDYHLRGGLSR